MTRPISIEELPHEVQGILLNLGGKITLARRARRWSQSDLAAKAGIGITTMVAIEKGSAKVQFVHWLSVLWALDLLDIVEMAAQPEDDALLKALIEKRIPERIRRQFQ